MSKSRKTKSISSGLNVIGKGVHIPEGTIIERNVRIFPHVAETDFSDKIIACGSTVYPAKEA